MKQPRNYWPLGIVLGSLLFVGIFAAFVVIACMHKSDLVSADYYDQEIKYQSRMESVSRTRQLSSAAQIVFDAAGRRILVQLPAEHSGKVVQGTINFYRPSAAGLDCEINLVPDPTGVQAVDVSGLARGLWKVRLVWTVDGQEYFMDQKVEIPAQTALLSSGRTLDGLKSRAN